MGAIETPSFRYPDSIKDRFLASADVVLRDGSHVSPAQIWQYLTEEGPVKYPHMYDQSNYFARRISGDVGLSYALKANYLLMTMNDRITRAKEQGAPVVFVQGGQSVDPYYAAGALGLRPASTGIWSRRKETGLSRSEEELRSQKQRQKAYNDISIEVCNSAGYEHIQSGLPVDMIAPYSCLRCSDVSYGLEAHRHGNRQDVKLLLVDYPLDHQRDKKWAIEYFADNLRRLTRSIDELTGRTTTAEDLLAEIKLHNEGRKLAVEIADLWWSAPVPPTNGKDRRDVFQMGGMEVHADPVATLSVLREAREVIAERVAHNVHGLGVSPDAKRIFVCGSCVSPNEYRVEQSGGIIVGNDNHWSDITTIVEEEGDPYFNLARAILSYPYEQPIKERAAWTVEQIKKSRADGVLFLYKWGCNTQSAVARMIVDEIKGQTGLPTLIIEDDMQRSQTEQLHNRINSFIEML